MKLNSCIFSILITSIASQAGCYRSDSDRHIHNDVNRSNHTSVNIMTPNCPHGPNYKISPLQCAHKAATTATAVVANARAPIPSHFKERTFVNSLANQTQSYQFISFLSIIYSITSSFVALSLHRSLRSCRSYHSDRNHRKKLVASRHRRCNPIEIALFRRSADHSGPGAGISHAHVVIGVTTSFRHRRDDDDDDGNDDDDDSNDNGGGHDDDDDDHDDGGDDGDDADDDRDDDDDDGKR